MGEFIVGRQFRQDLYLANFRGAPIVFFHVLFSEVIAVAIALPMAAISTLRRVRVRPFTIVGPDDQHNASAQVRDRRVAFICTTSAIYRHVPCLHLVVATSVPSCRPGGVQLVLMAFYGGLAMYRNFFFVRRPLFRKDSPGACRPCVSTP